MSDELVEFPEMCAAEAAFRWMECIPYLAQTKRDPVVERDGLRLFQGDCLHVLAMQADASIDSLVTDPPAGIGFMGKAWDDLSTWPIRRDGDAARETKPGKRKSGPDLDYDYGPKGRAGFIAFLREVARECFRVMKPGAHGLVWALPRTSHWTATALEEAGFEIRDCINHVFGSGFPKSLNVSKAIDKVAGATRTPIRPVASPAGNGDGTNALGGGWQAAPMETAPATEAAKQWDGWGTALKPAVEHWWLVRKPLEGTVTENVQEHGTGAINIDDTRVPSSTPITINRFVDGAKPFGGGAGHEFQSVQSSGRWPANVVLSHSPECRRIGTKSVRAAPAGKPCGEEERARGVYGDGDDASFRGNGNRIDYVGDDGCETVDAFECVDGCPIAEMDRQSGESADGVAGRRTGTFKTFENGLGPTDQWGGYGGEGGASRFFHRFEWDKDTLDTELEILRFIYSAKPSTAERDAGCDGVEARAMHASNDQTISTQSNRRCAKCNRVKFGQPHCECAEPEWVETAGSKHRNFHPTVKGQQLMRHLVRLITPPKGVVLDPFAGSGSTLLAANTEGFRAIGIEREADYVGIARKRIEHATAQRSLFAVGDELVSDLPMTVSRFR